MACVFSFVARPGGWLACLMGAWLLAGCASRIDWDGRIGSYTYDDAVKEWGPPDKSAVTGDGVTVAEWLLIRGRVHAFSSPVVPPFRRYGGYYPMAPMDYTSTPDSYLRLTFDPDKRLQAVKRFNK